MGGKFKATSRKAGPFAYLLLMLLALVSTSTQVRAQLTEDWHSSWSNGEGYAVVTSNINGRGIYVVGALNAGSSADAILIKYSVEGKPLWNKTYSYGLAIGVAVDNNGDLYVLGHHGSDPEQGGSVFLLKFDADGNVLWSKSEPDAYIAANKGGGLAVDGEGNVYVAGWTSGGDTLLLKYASNASLLWSRTWDSASHWRDSSSSLVVTGSIIYVAGSTTTLDGLQSDVLVLKYDKAGSLYWNATWDGYGKSVAYRNGLYVAGYRLSDTYDILLLKLNDDGSLEWSKTWDSGYNDYGLSIATDCKNVFVTGYSGDGTGAHSDGVILQYNLTGDLKWSKTWDSGLGDKGRGVFADWAEIYVTGLMGDDGLLLKHYYGEKDEEWRVIWGSRGSEYCGGMDVNYTEIYITGSTSYKTGSWPSEIWGSDIFLLKYSSNSNMIWSRTWNTEEYDSGCDVAVHGGYIYVAGQTSGGANPDNIVLLKYDSNGNLVWNRTWDSGGHDECGGITISEDGTIYVVGVTWNAGQSDILVLRYNLGGTLFSTQNILGTGEGYNEGGLDVAVSFTGAVYVTGFRASISNPLDSSIFLLELDFGWCFWDSGGEDRGYGVVTDSDGNAYIVGQTGSGSTDVLLQKNAGVWYPVWSRTWDSGGEDKGWGIDTDIEGNVYVTGTASNDLLIQKYDSDGNLLWSKIKDFGCSDTGRSIRLDNLDNLYISGTTATGLNPNDVFLIKLSLGTTETTVFTIQDGYAHNVTVTSNSTISNFNFNETLKQLSFDVTGPTGNAGYCNVTIPNDLLRGSPWTIYVNTTDCTALCFITENDTHTTVYIPYTFSTDTIKIVGTWAIPEFSYPVAILLLMATALVAATFNRRKRILRESQQY